MKDFIFGTLATDELRHARTQGLRAGVTHFGRRNPRYPGPNQPIILTLTSGPAHPGERAWVYWTVDGTDPLGEHGRAENGFVKPLEPSSSAWDTELWGYIQTFQASLPGQPEGTVVRYRLSIEKPGQGEVYADGGIFWAFYASAAPPPVWAQEAVVYHIFVDRFFPGTGHTWQKPDSLAGFFGGRIAGITEQLDYIAALGANTLYLSPIFSSPSHHGYDVSDLFEIEPRLGTKADLKRLLDDAHSRQMRVLLDFIPNHWSDLHVTFQDAIHNPNSPYRDWYTFNHWPEDYETFFGVKSHPQVNLRNPAARQHMLDAAAFWLEFGVDGYRVDYAIGPAMDFWADFRRVTRAARPDCWTFGEIVDPPDVQLNFHGLLDGAMDFMLLEALRQTFAFENWDAVRLGSFLARHEAFFPKDFSRPSFLDNHDMNRFLWAAGGDLRRLMLASLCQFALSGTPLIYYGTEVGHSQKRDVRQGDRGLPEESRLPMIWGNDQNAALLDYYRRLIAVRKSHASLKTGDFSLVESSSELLVFQRSVTGERILCLLNPGSQKGGFRLPSNRFTKLIDTGGSIIFEPDQGILTLPPLGGALFLLEE